MSTLLDDYEALVRQRRATRHFAPEPVDPALVDRLLGITQWAPSGYNLQPTRFVVVTDRAIRPALRRACMDQPQVEEAPVVIVFAGDHLAYEHHFEETLGLDLAAGAVTDEYAGILRKILPLAIQRGPARLNWLWKATLLPLVRCVRPVPDLPAVNKRFWLAKQAMLCAMNFMLAAEAAGLNTLPMEGFDTARLRRALDLPRCWEPMLVVPLGTIRPGPPAKKTRMPLQRIVLRR
ncbi:MAG: nitroreductase family protein [Terrimicrobiaceae bacterium]|nr:nitroreductase family protein [Terrimicrobiaceae bacterium]